MEIYVRVLVRSNIAQRHLDLKIIPNIFLICFTCLAPIIKNIFLNTACLLDLITNMFQTFSAGKFVKVNRSHLF